jgi:hypothetical protein
MFPPDPERVFCRFCGEEVKLVTNRLTNADRIRQMSDEELAEWLNIMQSNAWHRGIFNAETKHFPSTNAAWLDWLKQEVEDG